MPRTLRIGDTGPDVADMQRMLNYVSRSGLVVDGNFGRMTERALRAFQVANNLLTDGVYGYQSATVLTMLYTTMRSPNVAGESGNFYRDKIMYLVNLFVEKEVVYGPGRGLFKDGAWMVTWGPGSVGSKSWKAIDEKKKGPSFHCSSLVNFVLSYLINRNELYTHAGNCPSLFELIEKDNTLHPVDPTGKKSPEKFRGFGGKLIRMASDGDTVGRIPSLGFDKAHKYLDAKEITDRQDELGTITVWSQSTKNGNKYSFDHHVGFVIKHSDGLYRFASDGYVAKGGKYSCNKIAYGKLNPNSLTSIYQVFKFNFFKSLENVDTASVVFEQ